VAVLVACSSETQAPKETCDPKKSGTICTVAGSGIAGYGGDNGPAVDAILSVPQDLAIAPDGELWIIDFNNYLIRALDSKGVIRTVIGTGLLGDSPTAPTTQMSATQADFNHTPDLFFHEGYLYLAAWHNSRVKRIELKTMTLENFAGIGKRTLYSGEGGPALAAAVDLPASITADPDGNIVFMDQGNQVIRKVDKGGIITRIAGSCYLDVKYQCNLGETPKCPNSDKIFCGGDPTECAQQCNPTFGGDGGPALSARIAQPFGQLADPGGRLTYDSQGNLIFSDSNNHRLRKVDRQGMISTIAGTGSSGYSGDGGPATEAMINNPVDVEIGADGAIYFADTYNNCVRKIDPAGIISTVAGQCNPKSEGRGFEGDGGPPTKAKLNRPYGIELDLQNNRIYVADSYNQRVRVVNF
jgi:DNA-binding beta-propeller fold protein YncE